MELIETYTGFVELMQFDSEIHTYLVVLSVIKCSYLFIIWVLAFLIIVSNGTGSSKIFIFSSILLIITKSGFCAVTRRLGEQYQYLPLEGYGTGCWHTLNISQYQLIQWCIEDEKPGFFLRGMIMDRLPADICAHLLSESISHPRGMALYAYELWTICGRSVSDQALSDHLVEDVYALPWRNSSWDQMFSIIVIC